MLKVSSFKNDTYRKLSTKAKRLQFFLYPYFDLDHSLTLSKEQLRLEFLESPLFTPALFDAAWDELLHNSYLRVVDGTVYSTYTYYGDEKPLTYKYIPQLNLFKDETFLCESKRNFDLFFYFATSRTPGLALDVKIERLYNNKMFANKTNKNESILFPNFKGYYDIKKHLLKMIKEGYIEVNLTTETNKNKRRSITLGKNTEDAERLLDVHCEKIENRKRRFSNRRTHLISVQLAPAVVNDKFTKYEVDSYILDLRNIAAEYGWRLPFLYADKKVRDKSIEQIYMFKQQLLEKFGQSGIQFYRKALHNYFKDKSAYFTEHFNSFTEVKDWTNYITNYYVIPLLKEQVLTFTSSWEKCLSKKACYDSIKFHLDTPFNSEIIMKRDQEIATCDEEIKQIQHSLKPYLEYYSAHSTDVAKYDLLMSISTPLQKVTTELAEWKKIKIGAKRHYIDLLQRNKVEDWYDRKVPYISQEVLEETNKKYTTTVPFYNWLEK